MRKKLFILLILCIVLLLVLLICLWNSFIKFESFQGNLDKTKYSIIETALKLKLPQKLKIINVALGGGRDTALYLKCEIPSADIQRLYDSILSKAEKVNDLEKDVMISGIISIKSYISWWDINIANIDNIYTNDSSKIIIMKENPNNISFIYIEKYDTENKFPSQIFDLFPQI
jgi:hypothetical protein